ncbi:hypothetical protein PF005_g15434 [Phytophthora fragariae]|nr:hypothetical protein PF009_g16727 [Phytophthora fragariae]KAE9095879.1 hypothetical protein PF010_g16544 [Phytophthora fragariae]KAE9135507.1 hypothetical protein PF006_g14590 [Phytophthora fragariae]KAE9200218.1 hypothetical protein PF005_g15434 [Phytophthora fragariae]
MDPPQTLDTCDSRLLPNDSLATSVSAFIKWEEAAALEAFPLAVVPSNHPHTREKGSKMPRVSSIHVTKQKERHEEADELAATKFVLDDSTVWTGLSTEDVNEALTLHGKALAMAKLMNCRRERLERVKATRRGCCSGCTWCRVQNEFQLDVLLHLTCHLPTEQLKRALGLQRLKAKQDAGADFIITQFFFDVDNMIHWIADCKDAGITILPGYLSIQNYSSLCKFTSWCKTRVPESVLAALDTIKNDDAAVRRYGTQLAAETCQRLLAAGVNSLHFYTMNLPRP